jgi:hypothetical protein
MTETIPDVKGLRENTSNAFRHKLLRIAENLDLRADAMAAVMSFETAGTFDPTIRPLDPKTGKPLSSAIGLLQWLDITAKELGTTTEELSRMTAEEQLDVAARHFGRYPLRSIDDYYMVVFCPAAVGKPPTAITYSEKTTPAAYRANKALDKDKDGKITVAEASSSIHWLIQDAQKRPPIEVTKPATWLPRLAVAGSAAVAVALTWWLAGDHR